MLNVGPLAPAANPAHAQLTLPTITQERTPEAAERYETCLDDAETRPVNTLQFARDWELEGGGNPARHCLAAALFRLGEHEEAAWRFTSLSEEIGQRDPGLAANLSAQAGLAWLEAGAMDRAHTTLTASIEWDATLPDTYIARARVRAALFDLNGAAEDLEVAVALAPRNPDAWLLAAAAYRRMGFLDSATESIESALELAPNAAALLLERGNIRLLAGDLQGAQMDWETVVSEAPESAAADAATANLERLAARRGAAGD